MGYSQVDALILARDMLTVFYSRGLELLHNYRVRGQYNNTDAVDFEHGFIQILNLTGLRKALKKFEKVTKVYSLGSSIKQCIVLMLH